MGWAVIAGPPGANNQGTIALFSGWNLISSSDLGNNISSMENMCSHRHLRRVGLLLRSLLSADNIQGELNPSQFCRPLHVCANQPFCLHRSCAPPREWRRLTAGHSSRHDQSVETLFSAVLCARRARTMTLWAAFCAKCCLRFDWEFIIVFGFLKLLLTEFRHLFVGLAKLKVDWKHRM